MESDSDFWGHSKPPWHDPTLAYTVMSDLLCKEEYSNVQVYRFRCFGEQWGWCIRADLEVKPGKKHKQKVQDFAASSASCKVAVFCVSANVEIVPQDLAQTASALHAACTPDVNSSSSSSSTSQQQAGVSVMAAICDGPAIIYYTILEGLQNTAAAQSATDT